MAVVLVYNTVADLCFFYSRLIFTYIKTCLICIHLQTVYALLPRNKFLYTLLIPDLPLSCLSHHFYFANFNISIFIVLLLFLLKMKDIFRFYQDASESQIIYTFLQPTTKMEILFTFPGSETNQSLSLADIYRVFFVHV